MFGLGPATRVYLAIGATDLRKGFEGLFGLVKDRLELEPLSGHVVCFCNRSRSRIKLIFWDGSGLWCCGKRLAKGHFERCKSTVYGLNGHRAHFVIALSLGAYGHAI